MKTITVQIQRLQTKLWRVKNPEKYKESNRKSQSKYYQANKAKLNSNRKKYHRKSWAERVDNPKNISIRVFADIADVTHTTITRNLSLLRKIMEKIE